MVCSICGDEKADYYFSKHQSLCKTCNSETPNMSRIYNVIWEFLMLSALETVPASTRKEFYDDYKTSRYTIDQYIKQTTEEDAEVKAIKDEQKE